MTLRGKGINLQVLTECICYLLFGYLLFQLTYSGGYLNYVTPRMKPYLYGMSALMFLWTVFSGRYLLTPRYRVKLARSFVFIIPILLLVFRPADPGGSSMVRSYESSGFSMSSGNGGGQMAGNPGRQTAGSTVRQTLPAARGESRGPFSDGESGSGLPDGENTETDGYSGTDAYPEDDTGQSSGEENPWYDLNGLDEAEKTITIADEDYYTWMYELSNFYEKYEGYTIVMKGFVYRAPDIQKKCDFALVRLSMWCCAADLTPIGFLVDSDSEVTFKDDDWVTVTGTFGISEHEESLILKAQSIEAAGKPEEEYVYPYF